MHGSGTAARRLVRLLPLLALALAVVLAACSDPDGGSDDGAGPPTGWPVRGGTLTVTFQAEPTSLDPAMAWDVESWSILRLTYQSLLTYASDPGEAGTRLVPDLATEVPSTDNGGISADGTIYTFHIRKGVRFAPPVDREVTAADVKYSFERMMKQPLAPATFLYAGVVGAEEYAEGAAAHVKGFAVVDDRTVQVTLREPDVAFLQAMALPFASVLPKEWVERAGRQITRKPLGTGPYVIDSWLPGQSITAVRNANWTGAAEQWVHTMEFLFSVGPGTAVLRLQSGEIDVVGDSIPAAEYLRTKKDPTWGKYAVEAPRIAWTYLFMNVREEPFDDARVRQAVNYALDTENLKNVLAGQGSPLDQIYPDGMPGHEPDAAYYSHDPEKARQLLAEAGYPDGFSTTLVTHDVDPFPRLAKAVQADLKAIGIEADVEQMHRAPYWDHISLGESHTAVGLGDWYMDYPDPSDWIGPLFTEPVDGGANASFYESPEVDALYRRSSREQDPERRLALFREMQDIIMEDAPTAPLGQPSWNSMHGETTGGFYLHPVWVFSFAEYWKTDGR